MQVVLLSLSWPHLTGARDADPRNEVAALDQVATASENVAHSSEDEEEKKFRDQLITSIIDTTVHYENSNGFVPIVGSSTSKPPNHPDQPESINNITWSNSPNDRKNSTGDDNNEELADGRETDEFENDPAYSTEARMFLNFPNLSANNRRSFEYQTRQNDFELLKVRNDTPVVANYPDFYEEPPSSVESGNARTRTAHGIQGKGKTLENYTGNYGTITDNNDGASYDRYYPRNVEADKEKASREQEKVAGNYHQQDVLNYDGHGQSGPTSFPRTNQEANDLVKNNANYDEAYDSVAASSQLANDHQRFSRPVVVADPNYKFDQSLTVTGTGGGDFRTSRIIDSTGSELPHRYTMHNRDGRFRSDEDSRDMSDETDYVEYTERPRRVQKSRRRPSSDGSKRLHKEHRGSMDDSMEYEGQGKRYHSSRSKSHRQRVRGNSWVDEDRRHEDDDSYEETRYDGRLSGSETRHKSQSSKFKPNNAWNQISPNLEISHSSGIEIGQLEKPKLIVPVKVNLVPVANFDHATAMGNSQGFDMSNAVLQNIVSATPVSAVSTVSPPTMIGQDSKLRVSTPLPDIIVGQNSFHNSMQAVFPQMTEPNKYSANLKPQYVSSTAAPVFAVTPNPGLQSIPIQNVQATATPRPTYQMQQIPTGHMHGNIPQLIVPQPTHQAVPTLMQTPIQSGPDFIQVNPHGMHGQSLVNHGNLQVQSFPTLSTVTSTPQTIPVTKINLVTAESQNKKSLLSGSTANFLASATMAVGQGDQRHQQNGNSYYLQQPNTQQFVKPQVQAGLYQQNVAPKAKTYIQTTHLLPAVLQPMPTLTTFAASTPQLISEQQNGNYLLQASRDQNQQFVKIPHTGEDNGISTLRNIKLPSLGYPTMDSMGSTSNVNTMNAFPGVSGTMENAHLPYVGTRNVEIVNPNIKPSPVDTTVINSFETMHYPTAVFTTPFPMFTTTSVVTSRPAVLSTTTDSGSNVQGFVNSLTEIGSKNNLISYGDTKAYQSQDRPVFNPINFVPNVDVMKNQNALNSKLHANEPLQQNLNLVPLIPGGNFFKPTFAAQSELLVKPKLNTDLESYAEQMFKESLKTIYNSQKWNNDRKPGHRQNVTDATDIAKLKNELQRLKASLSDSKRNKDHEGHHSETKPQTAELPKKKDELLAALEQMLKSHPTDPLHTYSGNGRPHRYRRPSDQDKFAFGSNNDFRDTKHVRDFMTPPQAGSHRPKGHFHDKPGKKRPMSGPSRYNNQNHFHGPRTYNRHNFSPKSGGPEVPTNNVEPIRAESSQAENLYDTRHRRPEFKKSSVDLRASPTIATPPPDMNGFSKGYEHRKGAKDGGINHPRMHNYLGLLMKNKQLPKGNTPNFFQDKDQLKQFFEEDKQRSQQQMYDDTLRDYLYKMSEGVMHSNLGHTGTDTRRYLTQKSVV
ncbi:uncharacterized protein LOC143149694 [Ptiloglossa arizonensis]|uniref:uncharacterized protein LOC143149694 n=1 Tax=Ptiloglossa arizonensis TaxID=3350558 RepID=UPI003FA03F79